MIGIHLGLSGGAASEPVSEVLPGAVAPIEDPTDITGLGAWWDFSTLGLANGAAIASVTDGSGNLNDLSQGSGTLRPTFEAASKNGLGVALWDTTPNDWFSIKSGTGIALGTEHTVVLVVKTPASLSNQQMFMGSDTGNYFGYINSATVMFESHGGGNASINHGLSTNTWYILTFTRYLGGWGLALNGGAETKVYLSNGSTFTPTRFGAIPSSPFYYLNGFRIGEAIIYTRRLGTPERDAVVTYLNGKWAVY